MRRSRNVVRLSICGLVAVVIISTGACSSDESGGDANNDRDAAGETEAVFESDLSIALNVRVAADAATADLTADQVSAYLTGYQLDMCAGLESTTVGADGSPALEIEVGSETYDVELQFVRMIAVGEGGEGACRYVGTAPLQGSEAAPVTVRVPSASAEVSYAPEDIESQGFAIEFSVQ